MADDAYALLGVSPGASLEEVTQAYRALVQIYHPDRYADAPPRVQEEANKRMQALNAAYDELRRSTRRTAADRSPPPGSHARPPRREPPPPPRQQEPKAAVVYFVDGAPRFHSGDVAPLGFEGDGTELQQVSDARQCRKLNAELTLWFASQKRNASLAAKQLYNSWTTEEQDGYAAKLGCTQLPREKARELAMPCPECRP